MYDLYQGKLQMYPYKIFDVEGKKFIITNAASAIFEIDNIILDLISCENYTADELKKAFDSKYGETQLEEVLKGLTDNYVIKSNENIKKLHEIESNRASVNSITLMVCQECNLRCRYCFGEGGEYNEKGKMTYEVGKQSILFGFENNYLGVLSVVFFGGEPLLQFDLIKRLVAFSREEAENRKKKVTFAITTNATLVTDEIALFLKENNFNVTVSIDGDKEDNDKNRYYSNRQGAYDKILRGVQKMQQYGVHLSARGTVTAHNINMLKNWKHLVGLGFSGVHFAPAVNLMEKNTLLQYCEEDKKMVDHFFDCLKKEDYHTVENMHNIKNYVSRIHNGGMRFTCCGAYVRMIAVDIKGNIYPCHRFVALKEMCIGNIFRGWDREKCERLNENLQLSNSSCTNCWAVNLCGGGCPFENYMETKLTCSPNSFACFSNKSLLEYVIVKYLELSDSERDYFFEKNKQEEDTENEE